MKKMMVVICLVAGCSYGIQTPVEADVSTSLDMSDIRETDREIKLDLSDNDLLDKWQNMIETGATTEHEDNVFETTESTFKEGRFWTVVRKVFQPIQIVTSASTMALITVAQVVKDSHEDLANGLSYGALGTAVTSGILSLFITKMNSKICMLNNRYKYKLAQERKKLEAVLVAEPLESD